MKYYIKSNGKMYGPVDEKKIRDYVDWGYFSAQSQVSLDMKEWNALQDCISLERLETPDAPTTGNGNNTKTGTPIFGSAGDDDAGYPVLKPHRSWFNKKIAVIAASVLVILALCGGGAYFFATSDFGSPDDFQEVCQKYQSAVGVVTVTLEDSKGKLMSALNRNNPDEPAIPMGTAFAIGRNTFATNCHVAYGLQEGKNGVLETYLFLYVMREADNAKIEIHNQQEYDQYYKTRQEEFNQYKDWLFANVHIRDVEIRLARSNGRSLSVEKVQIHPRFQAHPTNEFKNGEYDVAILTTSESVDTYFKTATIKKLYALKTGQEIAYIGFPMEGLGDYGNMDLNNPEAVMKTGRINKITDFNNVFSSPEANKSIIHDIPSAGGASGSPIFLPNGELVAIHWGGNNHGRDSGGARIGSAVQHNYATRIDSLEIVKKQPIHDINDWMGETKND